MERRGEEGKERKGKEWRGSDAWVLPCQRIVEKHEPSKLFKPAEVAHLIPAGYPVSGEDERLKVGHARFQVCRDPRDPILVQIERPQPRKQREAPEFNDLVV